MHAGKNAEDTIFDCCPGYELPERLPELSQT
jgi:hypothetical protein